MTYRVCPNRSQSPNRPPCGQDGKVCAMIDNVHTVAIFKKQFMISIVCSG